MPAAFSCRRMRLEIRGLPIAKFFLWAFIVLGVTPAGEAVAAHNAQDAADLLSEAVVSAVDEIAPSVLQIETYGGLQKVGDVLVGDGPTTGLVVDHKGHLLCSAYSFAKQPTSILVTLPNGKRAVAKIVARDHTRMLVLLKVNSELTLQPPRVAPRDSFTVGQTVIAVGRTYNKKTPNVSVGILSAKNRIWGKAVQTDAKISPSNYGGPLIDLQGRVLGVLVPMSPQAEGSVAASQWYDSGIGFAAPLQDIMPRLTQLKNGEDLHAGKLGVSFAGKNQFKGPVKIAAVLPGSPAVRAGWKKGDELLSVDGKQVRWLAELKHALGPRYAGDKVQVVTRRGKESHNATVELVAEIAPFDVPFLGILPGRNIDNSGVWVRHVYPNSPAAAAGILPGDIIQKFAGKHVTRADALRDLVGTHDSASEPQIAIRFSRSAKPQSASVKLASLPTDIPEELPLAFNQQADKGERPAVGLVTIKLPEVANECIAYVPDSYREDRSYGLIVSLHASEAFDKKTVEPHWRELCQQHDLIILAPAAANAGRWQATEVEFVRKAIDEIAARYNIDTHRTVTYGYQSGGTFAALVAFANQDVIHGVVMVDAALPQRTMVPVSDPVQRFAFLFATAKESKLTKRIELEAELLRGKKLPATLLPCSQTSRELNDAERAKIARWVDSLDRI